MKLTYFIVFCICFVNTFSSNKKKLLISNKKYEDSLKIHLQGIGCGISPTISEAKDNIIKIEKWIKLHPDCELAYHDLAMQYYYLSCKDSTIKNECYKKCLAYSLKDASFKPYKITAWSYSNVIMMCLLLGKCDDALFYFEKIKKLNPRGLKNELRRNTMGFLNKEMILRSCNK
ncbi:MAG: hypothetical protein U0U67_05135 [Chitinophagales bacterium]